MTDQRKAARKILKVRAVLALEGQAPVMGKTADVGTDGISITMPDPVPAGQSGQVGFDLLLEGRVTPIHARARVMYCIFSSGEFKVGLQFLNLDMNAMGHLTRLLR